MLIKPENRICVLSAGVPKSKSTEKYVKYVNKYVLEIQSYVNTS